jgi:hypothetical protein
MYKVALSPMTETCFTKVGTDKVKQGHKASDSEIQKKCISKLKPVYLSTNHEWGVWKTARCHSHVMSNNGKGESNLDICEVVEKWLVDFASCLSWHRM